MKKLLPLTLVALAAASVASAQLSIVSFGGAGMVSANQSLGGNGSLLDPNTAISPASGYTGQTFYGGVQAVNTSVTTWQIDNNTGRGGASMPALDWITATQATTVDGAGVKFHRGVVFFQQADFLNYSTQSGGVTLQSLSVAVTRTSGSPSRFGFVIEADGAYYLSNPVTYNQNSGTGFNANFTNGHWLNIADVTAASWQTFDPELSYLPTGIAATTIDFTKVTGVGVWFENERASNSTLGLGFHITGLEAVAIPEPSAYAALLGLGVLGLAVARRRRA